MDIVVVSDIHGSLRNAEAIAGEAEKADYVVIAGDLTGDGGFSQAERILSSIEKRNRNIIAVHGNWDDEDVIAMLSERGYSIHGTGRIIDGVGFFGVGGSCPTPMNTPTEYSEEEIAGILKCGYEKLSGAEMKVLVSHAPPRGFRDRTFLLVRGGSISIRKFLDAADVRMCISGHIHEARGVEKTDSFMVVNPGSLKSGRYARVRINRIFDASLHRVKKGT